MDRFYGPIGYGEPIENPEGSGIYVDEITEFQYSGSVIRKSRSLEGGENLNDNISIGNQISIVADEYAVKHFKWIKYILWMGTRWTVTNVLVQSPRLILTLGNVYNGPIFIPEPEPESEPEP